MKYDHPVDTIIYRCPLAPSKFTLIRPEFNTPVPSMYVIPIQISHQLRLPSIYTHCIAERPTSGPSYINNPTLISHIHITHMKPEIPSLATTIIAIDRCEDQLRIDPSRSPARNSTQFDPVDHESASFIMKTTSLLLNFARLLVSFQWPFSMTRRS